MRLSAILDPTAVCNKVENRIPSLSRYFVQFRVSCGAAKWFTKRGNWAQIGVNFYRDIVEQKVDGDDDDEDE